ncbi:MAG: hypothetical protein F6J86_46240, partial [Symploca sp. SIO1B1]|nr:hypothetical protein [Symploca sp. SIO1B1]
EAHQFPITSINISPDGKLLATASRDGTAKLWDLQKQEELAVFKGHQDEVNSVSFSHDGKLLSTTSFDKTARLWDLREQQSPKASPDETERRWRVQELDELFLRGCNWLQDYFVTRPEVLTELSVCQNRY